MSIPTGDRPFDRIIDGLRSAVICIVRLSKASVNRRWINFEAGFFYGFREGANDRAKKFFPLVIRGMNSGVGQSLSEFQVRELANKYVLKDLFEEIANRTECKFDVEICGATFVNEGCVRSGNVVSGRTWYDNPFFMGEFMRMLKQPRV